MASRPIYNSLIFILILSLIHRSSSFIFSSRVVNTLYGSLRGIIVKPNNPALSEVEVFRGIPYAAPPTGRLRFMPPSQVGQWRDVRPADSMAPVCPQKLPDVRNRRESLKRMPVGRYRILQRLIPHLRNQSEDCLYLNIYAPSRGNSMDPNDSLAVLVYIHGESYEWNSGNPYDGTVLASYGQVIVITLNFRLGILGFLCPALSEQLASNFGLLDQFAALHWIRENIAFFGGDPKRVTIFGHGTGAALANLLQISPITQRANGLFHRAILMSGSALSKWAFTWDPIKYTIQVAKVLRCPLMNSNEDLTECFRSKSVEELLAVPLDPPPFTTPLGPVMDGRVIKQNRQRMFSIDKDALSKFDVLQGVTSAESFNILSASEVKYGMMKERRTRLLQAYMSNNYKHSTAAIYAAVDNEYTPWNTSTRSIPGRRMEMDLRDRVLEVLSDAQIVAPVVSMANLHSDFSSRSYFYVFNHQTLNGEYPVYQGTVHGEELPYVFGAPLVGGFNHFGTNYTVEEQFLSELVMRLWTNFAKTGNPNLPTPQGYKTQGAPFNWNENMRTLWPPYDRIHQEYLHIDMKVVKKSHYRAKKLALWNSLIPNLLRSSKIPVDILPPKPTIITLAPTRKPKPPVRTTPKASIPLCKHVAMPPVSYPIDPPPPKPIPTQYPKHHEEVKHESVIQEAAPSPPPPPIASIGTTPITIIILIGILILILNCSAIAGIYYKRDKNQLNRFRLSRRDSGVNKEEMNNDNEANAGESNSSKKQKDDGIMIEKLRAKTSKSKGNGANSEERGSNSLSQSLSSQESNLKGKQSPFSNSPFSSSLFLRSSKKLSSKEQKTNKSQAKSSPHGHRKNRNENSIYSEVSMQNIPEVIYRKQPIPKFRNEGSLAPKSANKSSTSITSIKSNTSIKSTSSRASVKSNGSAKPVKKNASCQSLPTPEYSSGITRDMTTPIIETRDLEKKFDQQNSLSAVLRKKHKNTLQDSHASTLPKVKPSPPNRSTSLTSREIEELEDINVIYQKGRHGSDDPSLRALTGANIEQFYETGAGEAPASPSVMYSAPEAQTATVRRSRKSDGFEYGQNRVYNQYLPYESILKQDTSSNTPTTPILEPVKNYSFGDSRSPQNSLGTFGKLIDSPTSKYSYDKSTFHPDKERSSFSSSSTIPTLPSLHLNEARSPDLDSPHVYLTKNRNDGRFLECKPKEESESSNNTLYNQSENTGTVRRAAYPSKYQPPQETADKQAVKPLKSVLKTTSAYDKAKPSASASSLSSSTSINSSAIANKSIYGTHEHKQNYNSSIKRSAKVTAPTTRVKETPTRKECKKQKPCV